MGGGQHILFYCFLNILVMHLPSFLWINVHQCLNVLEHILHYYITLAFFFFMFSYTLHTSEYKMKGGRKNIEILIGIQMSFYFMWHIYNKISLKSTLYPYFIKSSILMAIVPSLAIGLLWERDDTTCELFQWKDEKNKITLMFELLSIYSTFLLPDIAVLFLEMISFLYAHV